jgi:hypothetical protein
MMAPTGITISAENRLALNNALQPTFSRYARKRG